jgi:hypothetical protein
MPLPRRKDEGSGGAPDLNESVRWATQPKDKERKANGQVHTEHSRRSSTLVSDEAIIKKCRAATNCEKFSALFDHGDVHRYHDGDESRADASLLSILAFWTQDRVQLERIFSSSALGTRAKWRDRSDYRERTIGSVLDELREEYDWEKGRTQAKTSSSSSKYPRDSRDDEEVSPLVVERMKDLPRYTGKRPSVIEDIFPTGFPTSLYGVGGIMKSMIAMHMLLHIAAGKEEWCGFVVSGKKACLYIDFELDREEQGTRSSKLAAGMGMEEVPDDLHYLWASGYGSRRVFELAVREVEEHEIGVVCIDSVGMALQGDSIAGSDVIEFFRIRCDAFKRRGCAVLLVDHQSGLQPGESYQDKRQYGSVYKGYLSRSRLQLQKDPAEGTRDDGMSVIVRQNKTNFGPEQRPFKVEVTFEDAETRIRRVELEEEELRTEKSVNATDRILLTLLDGPAYPGDLTDKTAIAGTRNVLTKLRKQELIEETGDVEETGGRRAAEVQLTAKGRLQAQKILHRASSTSRKRTRAFDDDEEVKSSFESVSDLFANPPEWLTTHLPIYRKDPERHFRPFCNTVAAEVLGDPLRGEEVAEEVKRALWKGGKMNETPEDSMSQLGGTADAELRAQILRYSLENTHPQHHKHIRRLCTDWKEYNTRFFGGALIPAVILLNGPEATLCYGDCATESGFGCGSQIRIRPSILKGTLEHLRGGNKNKEGLMRFAEDVLLHEMIHQLIFEQGLDLDEPYNGHGSVFSSIANEIGHELGLPRVRRTNKSRDGEEPSPSQWPHNVRDPHHYLGAYVPASRDEEAILRRSLGVVLRKHGIEKVHLVADEVWKAIEEEREAKRARREQNAAQ